MKAIKNEKTFSKQRRQVLQGVGVTLAAAAFTPVVAASSSQLESAKLTGTIVSKINDPIKTLVIKNHSNHVASIKRFDNGGLMFDSEVIDCNSACIGEPLVLQPGEEKLVQFDFREKTNRPFRNRGWVNVQSKVMRLHEGTRVVRISGTITNDGVVSI